jgi:DNA-binding helix-hairpin-helix protein with protein kinase domain
MMASTFLVYFRRDNILILNGKSTGLEITRNGTLARDAAADPTATEWASWRLTSRHFFRFIADESRKMDKASASLDIFRGRTGSPASTAF